MQDRADITDAALSSVKGSTDMGHYTRNGALRAAPSISKWLVDAGIDDADGTIAGVLVTCTGGDDVSLLAAIKEPSLLEASGQIGLRKCSGPRCPRSPRPSHVVMYPCNAIPTLPCFSPFPPCRASLVYSALECISSSPMPQPPAPLLSSLFARAGGVKLRKLIAALPVGFTYTEHFTKSIAAAVDGTSASATGEETTPKGSAYKALVAEHGPPPASPRGANKAVTAGSAKPTRRAIGLPQSSIGPPHAAVGVPTYTTPEPIMMTPPTTPPTTPPAVALRASEATRHSHEGKDELDAPPIFTERTMEAIRVAAEADGISPQHAVRAAAEAGGVDPHVPIFTPRGTTKLGLSSKPLILHPTSTPASAVEGGGGAPDNSAGPITERTAAALKKLGPDAPPLGEDGGSVTPRTAAAVKISAQAMDDEQLAKSLQSALDEEASAAVASATLKQAKANPTKGKPSSARKSGKLTPKRGKSATRKANEQKGTSRFRIDIGTMKVELELEKKAGPNKTKSHLEKPLIESVVRPALLGYLSDKPACVREPLSAHPEDVVVSLEGEVIDAKASAKTYVNLEAEITIVTLLLPQWATDVINRAPAALAEILGSQHSARDVVANVTHLAGGLTTTTITTASAPFHVNIVSGAAGNKHGGKGSLETETNLNATWLRKPLREALVAPALKAYQSSNPSVSEVDPMAVGILVDCERVSGRELASTYVHEDGTPAVVEIQLPMELEIRISS